LLTEWKREASWLSEVSAVPLQQALRHLQTAYNDFFAKRAGKLRFKRKKDVQSATFMRNAFRWDGENLRLAKTDEPLPIRWSRRFTGKPSSVTVTLDRAGRYHVSILVDEELQPLPPVKQTVGIDCGLQHAVIPSRGRPADNPRFFAKDERKLAKAQRQLARKQKGSGNHEKARLRVARIHARIADRRKDWLHKLTTQLIRENQVVCAESLAVKNMVRDHTLAKAIHDVGWGELVRQLEYKAKWYGRTLVEIDQWFPSSKLCHDCGYKLDSLPLFVREWICPACGVVHDRDQNAAHNVESEGLRLLNPSA
jgi:putative transposase